MVTFYELSEAADQDIQDIYDYAERESLRFSSNLQQHFSLILFYQTLHVLPQGTCRIRYDGAF